uniref:Odorant receptor n=1 Tax=Musca domestica TaxID=7370 RepID=A0A1I8MAL5_MUSDO
MAEVERYFEDFVNLPCVLLKTLGYDFLEISRPWLARWLMKLYFFLTLICCLYCTYFVTDEIFADIVSGANNLPLLLRLINDFNYNAIGILKTLILFSPLAESIIEYFVDLIKVGYADAEFTYHKLYEEQSYVVDHRNPLGYMVIYSMEVMNSHYAIVFNICPDIWLIAYAIQLCMHFDYISRNLESYEPMEKRQQKDLKVMAELVRKHQVLLELADDLKEIFSLLVLVMLFSTVATLFCAAVYVLTQGINKNVLGYMAFLPTSLGQYFMVCYYGQLIINKSLQIGEAAYSQTWYNGCQSYKKSILAILGRAQRQCEINAGGFQTTNLKGFESVMRMTFQLFTLWRTMMEPK